MSREWVYKCDVCRTPKLLTNHWFLLTHTKDGLRIRPWSDRAAAVPDVLHLCGGPHLVQYIDKWAAEEAAQAKAVILQDEV